MAHSARACQWAFPVVLPGKGFSVQSVFRTRVASRSAPGRGLPSMTRAYRSAGTAGCERLRGEAWRLPVARARRLGVSPSRRSAADRAMAPSARRRANLAPPQALVGVACDPSAEPGGGVAGRARASAGEGSQPARLRATMCSRARSLEMGGPDLALRMASRPICGFREKWRSFCVPAGILRDLRRDFRQWQRAAVTCVGASHTRNATPASDNAAVLRAVAGGSRGKEGCPSPASRRSGRGHPASRCPAASGRPREWPLR